MPSVLICDDEAGMREMLASCLARENYTVTAHASLRDAKAAVQDQAFELIVTDLSLPDGTGMDLLQFAKESDSTTQVIVITGYATSEQAVEAMRLGAYDYIRKPFRNSELLAVLEKASEKRALLKENRALKAGSLSASGILGHAPAMRHVQELLQKAAQSKSSVLITGESGTGKELAARALHNLSDRKDKPFVVINCGAIPETLIESELFGHEKGAFTGANQRTDGVFRAADGGTLFLDEVGELPLTMQVRLLRALQERRVRPVGGTKELEVDVRVVAATNRNLEEDVASNKFRADLFYRLNVIRVALPPLRARTEDIPTLLQHFLDKHAPGRALTVDRKTILALATARLPGNVRELENLVERAVALMDGDVLLPRDFGLEEPDVPAQAVPINLGDGFNIDEHLNQIERKLLQVALTQSGGSQTAAAKLLGTTFRSMRYRLKKFGLAGDDGSDAQSGDSQSGEQSGESGLAQSGEVRLDESRGK